MLACLPAVHWSSVPRGLPRPPRRPRPRRRGCLSTRSERPLHERQTKQHQKQGEQRHCRLKCFRPDETDHKEQNDDAGTEKAEHLQQWRGCSGHRASAVGATAGRTGHSAVAIGARCGVRHRLIASNATLSASTANHYRRGFSWVLPSGAGMVRWWGRRGGQVPSLLDGHHGGGFLVVNPGRCNCAAMGFSCNGQRS